MAMFQYYLPEELAAFADTTQSELKALDKADIATVVKQFAEGAARAQRAGFDGAETRAGHGYLLSSFISPNFKIREILWPLFEQGG